MIDQQMEQEIALLHAHFCEGFGNSKRVKILYLLSERPMSVTELTEALDISQPTVSHHLKILRDRGLITAERDGTTVHYSLSDGQIIDALDLLRKILRNLLAQRSSLVGIV